MFHKFISNLHGIFKGIRTTYIESIIPSIPSKRLRNLLIRWCGANISKNVLFYPGFIVRNPKQLIIEDGVTIGPKCLLDARKGLTIHKNQSLHTRQLYGRSIMTTTIFIFVEKVLQLRLVLMLGFVVDR